MTTYKTLNSIKILISRNKLSIKNTISKPFLFGIVCLVIATIFLYTQITDVKECLNFFVNVGMSLIILYIILSFSFIGGIVLGYLQAASEAEKGKKPWVIE